MDTRLNTSFWALRIGFGVVPFLAGLDKFFNLLAHWTDYLNPLALQVIPVSPQTFMRGVGIVEMIVGVAILTRWTRLGAYVAAAWLLGIALNLVSMGAFLDIAARDALLAVGAFSLGQLAEVRQAAGATADVRAAGAAPRRARAA